MSAKAILGLALTSLLPLPASLTSFHRCRSLSHALISILHTQAMDASEFISWGAQPMADITLSFIDAPLHLCVLLPS